MTSTLPNDRNEERRRRVLLGPLPAGFLQTGPSSGATVDNDYEIAVALEQQQMYSQQPYSQPAPAGRLSVTIVQAKLVKNYGLTRMDPYVRMRVGHCIYETHTDPSGGKTPRWNKVVHCLLPPGVTSNYIEIFDECSFTMDELIAWTHVTIPTAVFNGETHEDWYPLTGKQGEGVEGMINLVFSYTPRGALPPTPQVVVVPTVGGGPGFAALPLYPAPQAYPPGGVGPRIPPQGPVQGAVQPTGGYPQPAPPVVSPVTPEQMKHIEEMFPTIDKEVIKSVVEANNGNKDAAVNCLLAMSE